MPVDLRGPSWVKNVTTLTLSVLNDDNKIFQIGVCLARAAELQVLGGL